MNAADSPCLQGRRSGLRYRYALPARRDISLAGTGADPGTRIGWVDVARGFSILLVVLLHANVVLMERGMSIDLYTHVNAAFTPVRMPLFFAVSGALAASLIRRDWATAIEKRIWYFFYLFALWSLINILLFKYVLWSPAPEEIGNVLLRWVGAVLHPRGGIWFIWALIFLVAFARCFRNRPRLAVGLSLGAGVFGYSDVLLGWGYHKPLQAVFMYLPFFVIPALLGRDLLIWCGRHVTGLFLAGAALVLAMRLTPDLMPGRLDEGAVTFLRDVGGLGVGVGAAFVLSGIGFARPILSYFGQRTLPIYLVHIPVLVLLAMALHQLEPPGLRLYAVPLCVVLAVAMCLGFEAATQRVGARFLFQPLPFHGRPGAA